MPASSQVLDPIQVSFDADTAWLLAIRGRRTRSARRFTRHLPSRWSWHHRFDGTLTRLRALPARR